MWRVQREAVLCATLVRLPESSTISANHGRPESPRSVRAFLPLYGYCRGPPDSRACKRLLLVTSSTIGVVSLLALAGAAPAGSALLLSFAGEGSAEAAATTCWCLQWSASRFSSFRFSFSLRFRA